MKRRTRAAGLALAASLLLGALPQGAWAAQVSSPAQTPRTETAAPVTQLPEDMPQGWSKEAMEAALENGLLQGYGDNLIHPKDNLTRAQLAAILARALGAAGEADVSQYQDVVSGSWYYHYIAKAVKMGLIAGMSADTMAPGGLATREQVFAVLARALKLEPGSADVLDGFQDGESVSSWAVNAVSALVEHGYVHGSENCLYPQRNITREEFAKVMHNIFKTYIKDSGTVTQVGDGSVIVSTPGVTLRDVTIAGDLVLGDGVGEGEITLDGVTVEGRVLVRGGGLNTVRFTGGCQAETVVVGKVDGNVRLLVEDGCGVGTVTVAAGEGAVVLEGDARTLVLEGNTPVEVRGSQLDALLVNAPSGSVSVQLSQGTVVDSLEVSRGTDKRVTISMEDQVVVGSILRYASTTLVGGGTVGALSGTGYLVMMGPNLDSAVVNPSCLQIGGQTYLVGMSVQELVNLAGAPAEERSTLYGYTWYVYGVEDYQGFFMAGVEDGAVVALYSNAPGLTYMGKGLGARAFQEESQEVEVTVQLDELFGGTVAGVYIQSAGFAPGNEVSQQALRDESHVLFHLTNAYRVYHGQAALAWSEGAAVASELHSQDMAEHSFYGHTGSDGTTPAQRLEAQGVDFDPVLRGENIVAGRYSAVDIHQAWVSGAASNPILLNPDYTHMGAGMGYDAQSTYKSYATENFFAAGETAEPDPAPEESETPAPEESETPAPEESETPAPGESETPAPEESGAVDAPVRSAPPPRYQG